MRRCRASSIYHSHVLEHLDRDVAAQFMSEVLRVLKPGWIQRIAVPDFEQICRSYLGSLVRCDADAAAAEDHEEAIAVALEQSVRREASGTSRQGPVRRAVENFLLGDARRRGETHQWAYDRVTLCRLLIAQGFSSAVRRAHDDSAIAGWVDLGLERDEQGNEYIPDSLYVEATK